MNIFGRRIWHKPALDRFVDPDGNVRHTKDGVAHRQDGPAVEYTDGSFRFYVDGILHRDDGPALFDRCVRMEWWENGVFIRGVSLDGNADRYQKEEAEDTDCPSP